MTPWEPGDLERLQSPCLGTILRELRQFVSWFVHGPARTSPRGRSEPDAEE